jgi:hypothetical protein
MFKIEIRWYRGQIIFSAFLLSLLSYILFIVLNLAVHASFLQPPIVFLFFWLVFRIPVFYAGLMTTNGYLAYAAISAIVFNGFQFIVTPMLPGTSIMYFAQVISACVAFGLAWLIHKYRVGFTFVPHGERATVRLKGINLKLLLFTIVGYAAISSSNYLYFLGNYTLYFLLLTLISLCILQYWIFRKEYSDD